MADTVKATLFAGASNTPGTVVFPASQVPVLANSGGILYSQLVADNGVDLVVPNAIVQADGLPNTLIGLVTDSFGYGFNGVTWDRLRAANVFKNVVATAVGDTVVWTPAAGKKIRLMGYAISVCGTLAVLGVQVIQLRDAATVIARHAAAVGATVLGDSQFGTLLDNGLSFALADNVLNINLGTAMASGGVYVNAWGTEE
jgi:hypothetical protein